MGTLLDPSTLVVNVLSIHTDTLNYLLVFIVNSPRIP